MTGPVDGSSTAGELRSPPLPRRRLHVNSDRSLVAQCVRHARIFFDRPDLDLAQAAPGTYALMPSPAMRECPARDYENMPTMIFGKISTFDDVTASIVEL